MIGLTPTRDSMEPPKTFRLPVIRQRTFIDTKVTLDNNWFENCTFRNCDIIYTGGPTETSACYFENVRWVFEGVAGRHSGVRDAGTRMEDCAAAIKLVAKREISRSQFHCSLGRSAIEDVIIRLLGALGMKSRTSFADVWGVSLWLCTLGNRARRGNRTWT